MCMKSLPLTKVVLLFFLYEAGFHVFYRVLPIICVFFWLKYPEICFCGKMFASRRFKRRESYELVYEVEHFHDNRYSFL